MKHVCVDQFALKIWVLNQEKISDQYYGKIPDQEFRSWSTKYLKLKIKNKIWCIHNFFVPVSNNASSDSSSILQVTVIGYFDISIFWYFLKFSLITVPAFHKDVSSIRSQKVISLTKSLLKINQPLKPIKLWISSSLSNQMLTFKNWSVCFSSMLGYIRFQLTHDNKKLWFSVTLLD